MKTFDEYLSAYVSLIKGRDEAGLIAFHQEVGDTIGADEGFRIHADAWYYIDLADAEWTAQVNIDLHKRLLSR